MENRVLRGEVPKWVEYEEAGLILGVDIQGGQKTGSFLDQRENRLAAAGYLRGRVLDAFCYDGGFALHAARRAGSVEAVDSSEAALERGARNALRNGIGNVRFVRANVFDRLHEASSCGERFDGVILDPPAFAKSRADLEAAGRAYKEINLRALKCLEPRGILVTCSCSYNLLEDEFVKVVAAAAADAKRRVIIVEKRSQARDHPVLLGLPESQYLKCLILKAE
jgi:23S rRNA (cytosine1962-C5)-methyltransferase